MDQDNAIGSDWHVPVAQVVLRHAIWYTHFLRGGFPSWGMETETKWFPDNTDLLSGSSA